MRPWAIIATSWALGCGAVAVDPTSETDTSGGSGDAVTSSTTGGSAEDDTTGEAASSGDGAETSGSGSSGTTGDTDPDATPFEHVFHTVLTTDGRLALESNLPSAVEACMLLTEAPCDDADADGLVDAWEDVVLDRMRPLRRLDEQESAVGDPDAVMADVGRVVSGPADGVRLFVMLGYSRDYGSCGFTSHDGDSERVALDLAPWPEGGAGGVVMAQAYTAAHEGTSNDHGRVFSEAELGTLVIGLDPDTKEPRWVVFPSADKHATYATVDICEDVSVIPCFDEDCAPDGVADPAAFDVLPVVGNAGEPEMPRLTDLSALGFPGDDAWAEQEFCGGLGGSGCSSSVREKLLVDPF